MRKRPSKAREFIERIAIPYTGDDCLTWPFGKSSKGYGRYRATINNRKVSIPASRFICIAVHGDPPTPRHEAAHSCGKGHLGCVNPRHLSWKTPKENAADKVIHGTDNAGQRNGRSKLGEDDVRQIVVLLNEQVPHRKIASKYKVCRALVSYIATGKNWSHVTGINFHD